MWSDSFGSHYSISVLIPLYLFGSHYICSDPLYLFRSKWTRIKSDLKIFIWIHLCLFESTDFNLDPTVFTNTVSTCSFGFIYVRVYIYLSHQPDLSNSWSRIQMHDELRYKRIRIPLCIGHERPLLSDVTDWRCFTYVLPMFYPYLSMFYPCTVYPCFTHVYSCFIHVFTRFVGSHQRNNSKHI
jgi:hypothetical protein